jgi:hypothetical protein
MEALASLRRAAGANLPPWAHHYIAKVAGGRALHRIDLAPLELVRTAPVERMTDPAYLAGDLLPRLGLNDQSPHLFPAALAPYVGRGLRHWQYPIQFGPYLAHVARHRISSYLEIGVEHGGTFAITVELLRRLGPVRSAFGVDLDWAPSLARYTRRVPEAHFAALDSRSDAFRARVAELGPFDLVLIDGDHSEEGCQADLDSVRDTARAIAFHDIVDHQSPGVARVWERFRSEAADEFAFTEFTEQYDEVLERTGGRRNLGIGLAVRRHDSLPRRAASGA